MSNPFGPVGSNGAANVNLYEYPDGATPVTASSGNVAAAIAAASLPAVAGKTNYITGFAVTGTGATAAVAVTVTITGILGGTLHFTTAAVAGATLANPGLMFSFPFPIPASAVNTAITVSCPSLGTGNTNSTTVVFGYIK